MGFKQGKFGLEYLPDSKYREPRHLPKITWIVLAITLVSFSITLFRRLQNRKTEAETTITNQTSVVDAKIKSHARSEMESLPPSEIIRAGATHSTKVRNLLMRLEAAEKLRDIEMAISTIEQIRSLPGNPAADLDDALARRLGKLNFSRLFKLKSPQWTTEVIARRGDSAARIAREHGSTVAAMTKLNGDVSKIKAGQPLRVMHHPRFTLNIYRMTKIADLQLNGKFFKRYYLIGDVDSQTGSFNSGDSLHRFIVQHGIALKADDRSELEMMLPNNIPIIISEFR